MLRSLTKNELALVAGTGWWRNGNYYTPADLDGDGDFDVIETWSGDPSGDGLFMDSNRIENEMYWSVGAAFGIGFGLEYNAEGLDINWTAGAGFYGEVGVADSASATLDNTTGEQDEIVVGELVVPTPGIEITETNVEVSVEFGIVVVDGNEPHQ